MNTMRVAAIQMNSTDDKAANLLRISGWLERAAGQGALMALLPENFAFMGADDTARRHAAEQENESQTLDFLADQASKHGMAIIGGSVLLKGETDEKLRNSCVVFDAMGKKLAVYDKIHLFDVQLEHESYRESDTIKAGDKPVMVEIEGWKVGLSICYDLRFPELYRYYSEHGCDMLTIPAAFTVPTGQAHWKSMLRTRAIENQCYVLAAGQSGVHPGGRRTWGHSMIIDPWGEMLDRQKEGEGVLLADIKHNRVEEVRHRLPALQHRRPIG